MGAGRNWIGEYAHYSDVMNTKTLSLTRSCRCLNSVLIAGVVACAAVAQVPADSSSAPVLPRATSDIKEGKLSRSDRHFVEKASESGMEEIAISQVAVSRATNPQVRQFAQNMVRDHGNAHQELKTFALNNAVEIPMKSISVEKWQKKDAAEFDKDYVAKMASDHKDAVKLFEKAAEKSDNAELKTWAGKTLPTLQAHLTEVESLKAMVK